MISEIHKERREFVMAMVGENGIAIIPNAPTRQRNSDVFFPYRPDSDFYYLTAFPEPDSVAILAPNSDEGDYLLFCREKNPTEERWEGVRYGQEGAVEHFGANASFNIEELDVKLPKLMEGRDTVHYCLGRYSEFDQRVTGWLNEVKSKARSRVDAPHVVFDVSKIIAEMRVYKSELEIVTMQVASKVSALAHKHAMDVCKPGMTEFEIQAVIEFWFRKYQCPPAYPSIVASGENACILHYVDNSREMMDGDLLLIDAGAEYDCYAADITRTFPVNGKFSGRQKAVYEVVLEAQQAAIDTVRTGSRFDEVGEAANRVISQGLIDLGILEGSVDAVLEQKQFAKYYMHKIGHWLGMDVHDVGSYLDEGKSRPLKSGMCMTVEPGLYLSASDDLDEKWHGIGIRIEDDVLVTDEGNHVLTFQVPKSISAIEELMAG